MLFTDSEPAIAELVLVNGLTLAEASRRANVDKSTASRARASVLAKLKIIGIDTSNVPLVADAVRTLLNRQRQLAA
jgi:hypothetical protein